MVARSATTVATLLLLLVATGAPLPARESLAESQTNQRPVVDPGQPQTVTLPNTANLTGVVADDGLPAGSKVSALWSKASGPGSVSFANAAMPVTTATFPLPGTYSLRLTANDGVLAAVATVTITVLPVPNDPPVVNAGPDQSIVAPNLATLTGLASDDGRPSGSTLKLTWTERSGEGRVTFASPNSSSTTARFSLPGTCSCCASRRATALSRRSMK